MPKIVANLPQKNGLAWELLEFAKIGFQS